MPALKDRLWGPLEAGLVKPSARSWDLAPVQVGCVWDANCAVEDDGSIQAREVVTTHISSQSCAVSGKKGAAEIAQGQTDGGSKARRTKFSEVGQDRGQEGQLDRREETDSWGDTGGCELQLQSFSSDHMDGWPSYKNDLKTPGVPERGEQMLSKHWDNSLFGQWESVKLSFLASLFTVVCASSLSFIYLVLPVSSPGFHLAVLPGYQDIGMLKPNSTERGGEREEARMRGMGGLKRAFLLKVVFKVRQCKQNDLRSEQEHVTLQVCDSVLLEPESIPPILCGGMDRTLLHSCPRGTAGLLSKVVKRLMVTLEVLQRSGGSGAQYPILPEKPPQGSPRDTVELLLQVHKTHVYWLGELPCTLQDPAEADTPPNIRMSYGSIDGGSFGSRNPFGGPTRQGYQPVATQVSPSELQDVFQEASSNIFQINGNVVILEKNLQSLGTSRDTTDLRQSLMQIPLDASPEPHTFPCSQLLPASLITTSPTPREKHMADTQEKHTTRVAN
ncbi:hypothetical protein CCH79_00017984 [Gambusia affinis]|uniref:Syntaxin N-terminal domain-containing protein n=1 Tax=Gambusia affinis TaxID=33528 RepID=A0A315VY60_GAMAF|nr:hypothetical protein CCH79_00017984 [Gambusia affinis]